MKEFVKELKEKLELLSEKENALKEAKEEFQKKILLQEKEVGLLKNSIELIKENLEPLVIREFKKTGNKKFYGGLGVQERKEISFDKDKAFEWAKEKQMFLALDEKAFKKSAESLNLEFVTIDTKEKVTYPKEIKLED